MNYQSLDQNFVDNLTPVLSDQEEDTQNNKTQQQALQFLYISPNLFNKLWPEIKKQLCLLKVSQNNLTAFNVQQVIEEIYCLHFPNPKQIKNKINFRNFCQALDGFPQKKEFLAKIPQIVELALKMDSEFTDYLSMLIERVELKRIQVAILLANMFLCVMHLQPDYKLLPSVFIMAKLFNISNEDNGQNNNKIQKIRCLIYYFLHVFSPEFKSQEKIIFTRKKHNLTIHNNPLCEFIYCEYGQMENVQDCYIVDFANKKIGGGVLNLGCVQEEILFLTHPEALASLLITTEIKPDESIIIEKVNRLIMYDGYKDKFECKGTIKQIKSTNFICIDAGDYSGNYHLQYKDIKRELIKSYSGFYGIPRICTGKWGCGVFGGEWQLKALIQWVAASLGGCKQLVFINDESYAYNQAFNLLKGLNSNQLWEYIQKYCYKKSQEELNNINAIDFILSQQKF
ncbi:unnamed protein product [Paramecium pentaurelia]|uniref:poly(ADP-ribose) glycohydrolase n=1 Tax=Paramecium pentaurelia TaxID=43138 RepID=A0A8S1VAB7_9CILI|nr:unnamed protein product [Paramecium pentaurelia]